MSAELISLAVIVGASGIIGQVVLLRELLVSFCGNELTLGIILANWLIAEALGVFVIGRIPERSAKTFNLCAALSLIFITSLPLGLWLSRTYKGLLGIPSGEGVGIGVIFFSTLLIQFPVSFAHGGLFNCLCRLFPRTNPIGTVYALETIGTIIGGILLNFLLLPHLSPFASIFILILVNLLAIYFILLKKKGGFILLYSISIFFVILCILTGGVKKIDRASIKNQWKNINVIESRNSIYGTMVVARKESQTTFFYNGIPAVIVPDPDTAFVEEFAHLPLLFHKHETSRILLIESAGGGLIKEILKHPAATLDYTQLDPMVIEMLTSYAGNLITPELKDPRVTIIKKDGRFFLRNTTARYDIIMVGLSEPADLASNRFFSEEFFTLAKNRLMPTGIIALRLPGSLSYLTPELKNLNACVLNALSRVFAFTRIIPGNDNMFLASNAPFLTQVTAAQITKKLHDKNIETKILTPEYIEYRLNHSWVGWFKRSMRGATIQVNRDIQPIAVFEVLALWSNKFSPRLYPAFSVFRKTKFAHLVIAILAITLIIFFVGPQKKSNLPYICSIATTGFFGMLLNLALLFWFQVSYGNVFYKIAILISVFMSGIAAGGMYCNWKLRPPSITFRMFMLTEVAEIIYCAALSWIIVGLGTYTQAPYYMFFLLFFLCGFLTGFGFPLGAHLYLNSQKKVGEASGILYAADLLGGWCAGMLGGIFLLPLLGLPRTCLLAGIVKTSSLLVLFAKGGFSKKQD